MRHDDRGAAGGLAMINLSLKGDEKFFELARLAPGHAHQAILKAMTIQQRRARSKLPRAEAQAHGMPVSPLRRVRTKKMAGGREWFGIWFGYNPIAAAYVGGAKKGAEGAFTATMPTGHEGLFRRTGEAKRLTARGRYADTKIRREPIKEVKLPLPQAVSVAERLAEAFGVEAEEILAQELEYALLGRP